VVEPDTSVLDARPRLVAFAVLGAAVGTWYVVFRHVHGIGPWTAVAIIAAGVMPGMLGLVLVALPLSRIRWKLLAGITVALALIALACSETNQGLAANFAKFWAAVFAGWMFLYLFESLSLVVVIAPVIAIVDAISVFAPQGPTHQILQNHPGVYSDVAIAFPASSAYISGLGPPDILFYALFLGAAWRWGLRTNWTWFAMTGMYGLTLVLTQAVDANGLPALPFLSAGFLGANADLLWKAVRKRV
jgi:hypothetical protein